MSAGVLPRRTLAWAVDVVVVLVITTVLALAIAVVGLVTLGLGWSLFALLPATGIVYSAATIGGPAQATLGMRMNGLRAVQASDGGRVHWIAAAVHALLFWAALTSFVLWALDVLIGVARADARLGHDLLVNVAVVRR